MQQERKLRISTFHSLEFKDQVHTLSDLYQEIETRAHKLFPEDEEPPLAFSTMENSLVNGQIALNLLKYPDS